MTQPPWHPNHGPTPEQATAAIRTAAGQDQPHDRRAELSKEQREERRQRALSLIETELRATATTWQQTPPRLDWAAAVAFDALGDLAAEILVDGTMMRSLTIRDGVATLELAEATELVRIFAAGMRGVLDGHGASNYVEMEMVDGSNGDAFTVTVQRREGTTPHQFRQQAEAEVARLRAELAQARGAVLTEAERQFLTFALDQAAEEMSLNDGFTEDDEAALKNLRRMAVEAQHTPNTPPAEAEWVLETLWRTTGEWRRHWPARATRNEAEQDHERSAAQDPGRKYRIVRVETTTTVEAPPHRGADLVMPVHLRAGANAEDCPACEGTNPPYPFICPGPPATE